MPHRKYLCRVGPHPGCPIDGLLTMRGVSLMGELGIIIEGLEQEEHEGGEGAQMRARREEESEKSVALPVCKALIVWLIPVACRPRHWSATPLLGPPPCHPPQP